MSASSRTPSPTSNTFSTTCAGNGTRFEIECYDIGHLYTLAYFLERGLVKPPLFVQSVFGILGGIGTHPEDVAHMKRTADRLFGNDYHWSVLGAGRNQLPIAGDGRRHGRQCARRPRGLAVDRPGPAREIECRSGAPRPRDHRESRALRSRRSDEAREILSLKGGDKVAF